MDAGENNGSAMVKRRSTQKQTKSLKRVFQPSVQFFFFFFFQFLATYLTEHNMCDVHQPEGQIKIS